MSKETHQISTQKLDFFQIQWQKVGLIDILCLLDRKRYTTEGLLTLAIG